MGRGSADRPKSGVERRLFNSTKGAPTGEPSLTVFGWGIREPKPGSLGDGDDYDSDAIQLLEIAIAGVSEVVSGCTARLKKIHLY